MMDNSGRSAMPRVTVGEDENLVKRQTYDTSAYNPTREDIITSCGGANYREPDTPYDTETDFYCGPGYPYPNYPSAYGSDSSRSIYPSYNQNVPGATQRLPSTQYRHPYNTYDYANQIYTSQQSSDVYAGNLSMFKQGHEMEERYSRFDTRLSSSETSAENRGGDDMQPKKLTPRTDGMDLRSFATLPTHVDNFNPSSLDYPYPKNHDYDKNVHAGSTNQQTGSQPFSFSSTISKPDNISAAIFQNADPLDLRKTDQMEQYSPAMLKLTTETTKNQKEMLFSGSPTNVRQREVEASNNKKTELQGNEIKIEDDGCTGSKTGVKDENCETDRIDNVDKLDYLFNETESRTLEFKQSKDTHGKNTEFKSQSEGTCNKMESRHQSEDVHHSKAEIGNPSEGTHGKNTEFKNQSEGTCNKMESEHQSEDVHHSKAEIGNPSEGTHFNDTELRSPSEEMHNKDKSRSHSYNIHNKSQPWSKESEGNSDNNNKIQHEIENGDKQHVKKTHNRIDESQNNVESNILTVESTNDNIQNEESEKPKEQNQKFTENKMNTEFGNGIKQESPSSKESKSETVSLQGNDKMDGKKSPVCDVVLRTECLLGKKTDGANEIETSSGGTQGSKATDKENRNDCKISEAESRSDDLSSPRLKMDIESKSPEPSSPPKTEDSWSEISDKESKDDRELTETSFDKDKAKHKSVNDDIYTDKRREGVSSEKSTINQSTGVTDQREKAKNTSNSEEPTVSEKTAVSGNQREKAKNTSESEEPKPSEKTALTVDQIENDMNTSEDEDEDEDENSGTDDDEDEDDDEEEAIMKETGGNHNFICGYCDVVFTSKAILIQHKCSSCADDLNLHDDETTGKIHDDELTGDNQVAPAAVKRRKLMDDRIVKKTRKTKTDEVNKKDNHDLMEAQESKQTPAVVDLTKIKAEDTSTDGGSIRRSARKNKVKVKMKEWLDEEDEEDPYICGECGQTFDKENLLLRHMKSHNHSDFEDYSDTDCSNDRWHPRTQRPKRKAAMSRISCDENAVATRLSLRSTKRRIKSSDSDVIPVEEFDAENDIRNLRSKRSVKADKVDEVVSKSCVVCGEYFTRLEALKEHLLEHCEDITIDVKPLLCAYCDKKFVDQTFIEKHEELHVEKGDEKIVRVVPVKKPTERKYKCSHCNKTFKLKGYLRLHEKSHKEKHYKCSLCEEEFKIKGDYLEHKRTHKVKQEYRCELCGKEYAYKSGLTIHMKSHVEKPTFDCLTCNRSFFSQGHLAIHIKGHKHAGTKKHRCQECGYQVYDEEKLFRHLESHINQDPYMCPFCGKLFMKKSTFVKHKKKHSGENMCDVCGKAFSHRSGLERHYTIHSGEKSFKCEQCDKSFSQQSNLTTHQRQHSGEKPYMCEVCAQSFTNKCSLVRHMNKHTDAETQMAGGSMLNKTIAW